MFSGRRGEEALMIYSMLVLEDFKLWLPLINGDRLISYLIKLEWWKFYTFWSRLSKMHLCSNTESLPNMQISLWWIISTYHLILFCFLLPFWKRDWYVVQASEQLSWNEYNLSLQDSISMENNEAGVKKGNKAYFLSVNCQGVYLFL